MALYSDGLTCLRPHTLTPSHGRAIVYSYGLNVSFLRRRVGELQLLRQHGVGRRPRNADGLGVERERDRRDGGRSAGPTCSAHADGRRGRREGRASETTGRPASLLGAPPIDTRPLGVRRRHAPRCQKERHALGRQRRARRVQHRGHVELVDAQRAEPPIYSPCSYGLYIAYVVIAMLSSSTHSGLNRLSAAFAP